MKSERLRKELEEKFRDYLLQVIKEKDYYLRSHQFLNDAVECGIVQALDILLEGM